MAQLSLRSVSKRFGETEVVKDFSLEIERGEFISLLGPSGCGKTTVLRMIAGFETVSGGEIGLGEKTLASSTIHVLPEERNMGMVFQSYALWPHMTVAENISYPLKVRKVEAKKAKERLEDALEATQLTPFADRFPRDLSGGQRQRVALARCLVMDPDVILLDEPLANLDQHLRARMEETFKEFHHRTGATMIYVTHDQAEAMALSDRIAVMEAGRLVQFDPPHLLYQQPRNASVAGLIGTQALLRAHALPRGEFVMNGQITTALQKAAPDSDTQIMVRPENVVRVEDGGIPARVISAIYRGERFLISLQMPDQQILPCFSPTPLKPGEEIRVEIERAWVLPQ